VNVTAFSDASFCHRTNAAAWAGWVKSDRGRVYRGGVIRVNILNSSEAEFCALANTLALAEKRRLLQIGDRMIAQTDSLRVQSVLSGTASLRLSQRERQVVNWVRDLVARMSLRLDVRHVKGHLGSVTPRNAVNTVCDTIARQHMRQERARRQPRPD
jgi:ribonuclease HI